MVMQNMRFISTNKQPIYDCDYKVLVQTKTVNKLYHNLLTYFYAVQKKEVFRQIWSPNSFHYY